MTKEINLNDIEIYIKALHCPIRWDIINIIKDTPKTSEEIYNILKSENKGLPYENRKCFGRCMPAHHKNLKMPTLYYHLRELENAGLIKGKKIIDEEGTKSKEKEWSLTVEALKINFTV
jgi:DNA-binding transcriptional ArsR family regulator